MNTRPDKFYDEMANAEMPTPQRELEGRIDRIQMLCEIVDQTTAIAGQTADRLFGSVPSGIGAGGKEGTPDGGALVEMDRALDRMEAYVRRCQDNVQRLEEL